MDCRHAKERIEQAFDEGAAREDAVEEHLEQCTACRAFAETLNSMDGMLHDLPFDAPEGIEQRVLAAVTRERSKRNRPSVIGALAACGLIGATALNRFLPIQKIETLATERLQAWIPDTEWLGSNRPYRDQIEATWQSVLANIEGLEWQSSILVWSALTAAVTLLFVLNGICAAQLRQTSQ